VDTRTPENFYKNNIKHVDFEIAKIKHGDFAHDKIKV